MQVQYFDCQCSEFGHTVRFVYDDDSYEGTGELWLETRLVNWLPWYKRVWAALRYVFKVGREDGEYDTTLLKVQDYDRLRELLSLSETAHTAKWKAFNEKLAKQEVQSADCEVQ